MPDEITGSHRDPAQWVDGRVLAAQPGTRGSLRTGAPLSTHVRVISCADLGALLSSQHVTHFRPPLRGHSQGAGCVGSESPCSLLTDSCLFQRPAGRAQMQTVQGGTEGTVPGASKGGHPCRGSAVPSRTWGSLQTKDGSYRTLTEDRLQGEARTGRTGGSS